MNSIANQTMRRFKPKRFAKICESSLLLFYFRHIFLSEEMLRETTVKILRTKYFMALARFFAVSFKTTKRTLLLATLTGIVLFLTSIVAAFPDKEVLV